MSQVQVGDIVKSFDFNGNNSCYMIGKVVGVFTASGIFRAKFIKRVFAGVEDKKFKTDYFTAPLQGESFLDTPEFQRVVVIG